jgi:ElaB/YqjD/DUF883 family membrane-anchored ribosome-binding protein
MSTTPTDLGANGPRSRDPEAIARAIDETRTEVDETLDALQARLSPGQILDRAMELVRANGGQFASNLGRTVRDNPVPLILTGVGLAWMMATSRSAPSPATDTRLTGRRREGFGDMSERVSGAASDALSASRNRIAAAAESASEAASNTASMVSDELGNATNAVKDQSRRMSEGLAELLREQPLLVGAVGIALGAILGYALPPTDAEDRLLGEARDTTVERAAQGAQTLAAQANETVSEATKDYTARRRQEGAGYDTRGDHEAQGLSERT